MVGGIFPNRVLILRCRRADFTVVLSPLTNNNKGRPDRVPKTVEGQAGADLAFISQLVAQATEDRAKSRKELLLYQSLIIDVRRN